jgi:hypothetical protein
MNRFSLPQSECWLVFISRLCSQGELFHLVLLPSLSSVRFSVPISFYLAVWRSTFVAPAADTVIHPRDYSSHASPRKCRAMHAGPCASCSFCSTLANRSLDSICVARKCLCSSIPQSAHQVFVCYVCGPLCSDFLFASCFARSLGSCSVAGLEFSLFRGIFVAPVSCSTRREFPIEFSCGMSTAS